MMVDWRCNCDSDTLLACSLQIFSANSLDERGRLGCFLHWTNLPGQWLQYQANGSNVRRVLREGQTCFLADMSSRAANFCCFFSSGFVTRFPVCTRLPVWSLGFRIFNLKLIEFQGNLNHAKFCWLPVLGVPLDSFALSLTLTHESTGKELPILFAV